MKLFATGEAAAERGRNRENEFYELESREHSVFEVTVNHAANRPSHYDTIAAQSRHQFSCCKNAKILTLGSRITWKSDIPKYHKRKLLYLKYSTLIGCCKSRDWF